jgi:hypothetical protein
MMMLAIGRVQFTVTVDSPRVERPAKRPHDASTRAEHLLQRAQMHDTLESEWSRRLVRNPFLRGRP